MFAAYCRDFERWRQAEAQIDETGGLTIETENGTFPNPLVAVSKRYHDMMMATAMKLGLTSGGRQAVARQSATVYQKVGEELDVDGILDSIN